MRHKILVYMLVRPHDRTCLTESAGTINQGFYVLICYYTAICLKLMVIHTRVFMDKAVVVKIFTFYAGFSYHVTV
jgi:hypothetical protein